MAYDIRTALQLNTSPPSPLWRPLSWLEYMMGDDSWRERLECSTHRYGIRPEMVNKIIKPLSDALRTTHIREVYYSEEWYDRQAMRRGRHWLCKRTPTSADGTPLQREGPYAYSVTWTIPAESPLVYGTRLFDFVPWTSWDDNGGTVFARLFVHRIIMLADETVVACDRVTFENDDDVYCVINAVTLGEFLPEPVEEVLEMGDAVRPVRDEIVEYLFRHDREAYEDVIRSWTVPRLSYHDMRQAPPPHDGDPPGPKK